MLQSMRIILQWQPVYVYVTCSIYIILMLVELRRL